MTEVSMNPSLPQDDGGKSKLKGVKRVEVQEGMTVKDVEASGSTPQKMVASVFDRDINYDENDEIVRGDGKYDKSEAKLMNQYRFAHDAEKNEFRAHNLETGNTVVIKYNTPEEFEKYKVYILQGHNRLCCDGTVTVDLRNRTLSFEDVSSGNVDFYSEREFDNIVIKNSTLDEVWLPRYKGTVTLDGYVDNSSFGKLKITLNSDATLVKRNDTGSDGSSYQNIKISRVDDEE